MEQPSPLSRISRLPFPFPSSNERSAAKSISPLATPEKVSTGGIGKWYFLCDFLTPIPCVDDFAQEEYLRADLLRLSCEGFSKIASPK